MPYDLQAGLTGFKPYKSKRIVRAALIRECPSPTTVTIEPSGDTVSFDNKNKPVPAPGWWVLMYDDGYVSFCPPESFTAGYVVHEG